MKALWKKTAILLLGFSNLAILGAVFHTYFDNEIQPFQLFSSSDDLDDLKKRIETKCKDEINSQLIEGDQQTYTCFVNLDRKQRGARYKLKTYVEVIKTADGKFKAKREGLMTRKKQHATEAKFTCNGCGEERLIGNNNLKQVMLAVVQEAEKIYAEAEKAVADAEKEYNKKDRLQRMARLKERGCEGKWDREAEDIVEFDLEEKLECKMKRISSLDLPLEIEEFYHKDFKRELWKVALSDEDYLLEDMLDNFDEAYRYPFSVRASTGLMKSYLDWKEDFVLLDSLDRKQQFVRGIQSDVQQMTNFMTQDQAQKDLFFLNQGFEGILANQLPTTRPKTPTFTTPGSTGINYEDVKRQVKDLY